MAKPKVMIIAERFLVDSNIGKSWGMRMEGRVATGGIEPPPGLDPILGFLESAGVRTIPRGGKNPPADSDGCYPVRFNANHAALKLQLDEIEVRSDGKHYGFIFDAPELAALVETRGTDARRGALVRELGFGSVSDLMESMMWRKNPGTGLFEVFYADPESGDEVVMHRARSREGVRAFGESFKELPATTAAHTAPTSRSSA